MTIYTLNPAVHSKLPASTATNGEYMFWWPHWRTIRDALMGEIMVKGRREEYLPKLEKQTQREYDAYLARATFYNAVARTVSGIVGAVHNRSPLMDGVPEDMDLSSVTNDGQNYDMFARKITREVVAMGRYGILIDAPAEGGEPYFVGYDTEDIVDWSTTRQGSRERLTYVVLREYVRTRELFDVKVTEVVEQYRVLFIDPRDGLYKQRLYDQPDINGVPVMETVPTVRGTPLTEIPFLMIGPYDFGYEIEKPPIMDLVLLNLSHYRSYAQLEAGRFYTANPVYVVGIEAGGDEDAEYVIGPQVVWQIGARDKAEILEFSGAGLKYLESALETKERQMASLGGKLASSPFSQAAESAEGILARERSEASFLGAIVSTMSEVGSRLLSTLAYWRGTPAEIRVTYASEATEINLDARSIRAMAMLYDTGLLPLETIFTVFRQNNIIPRGISFEEFKAMLPEVSPKVEAKLEEAEGRAKIEAEYAPPEAPPQSQPRTPNRRTNANV